MARVARGIHQVHISTEWKDVPVLMDAAAVARVLGGKESAAKLKEKILIAVDEMIGMKS